MPPFVAQYTPITMTRKIKNVTFATFLLNLFCCDVYFGSFLLQQIILTCIEKKDCRELSLHMWQELQNTEKHDVMPGAWICAALIPYTTFTDEGK